MGYTQLRDNLTSFDELLKGMSLELRDSSPVHKHVETTREFLNDHATKNEKEWMPKWQPRFEEFYNAQIVTKRLTDAALAFTDQTVGLRKLLNQILMGDLIQNFQSEQSKDYFYELELASDFQRVGFNVSLSEPDITVTGNGLSKTLGIACKYPSSEKRVHSLLSKGYSQLGKNNLDGFVAIGFDQLVFKDVGKYLDFRQGDKPPLEVMQTAINEAMSTLVTERPEKYPAEDPVDGAIITLRAGGIYGEPAGMAIVTAVVLQCDSQNSIFNDVSILYNKLSEDGLRTA